MQTDVTTLEQLSLLSKGSWAKHRCFIVGCGPSLMSFNLQRLEGHRSISLNGALMLFNPTVAFSIDVLWVQECQSGLHGPELMFKWQTHPCRLFQNAMEHEDRDANACLNALKVAVWLEAPEVYLLGIDFGFAPDGDGYVRGIPYVNEPRGCKSKGPPIEELYREYFIPAIGRWAASYEGPSRIVNLNPDSNLKCFKFGDVDDVLPKKEVA